MLCQALQALSARGVLLLLAELCSQSSKAESSICAARVKGCLAEQLPAWGRQSARRTGPTQPWSCCTMLHKLIWADNLGLAPTTYKSAPRLLALPLPRPTGRNRACYLQLHLCVHVCKQHADITAPTSLCWTGCMWHPGNPVSTGDLLACQATAV